MLPLRLRIEPEARQPKPNPRSKPTSLILISKCGVDSTAQEFDGLASGSTGDVRRRGSLIVMAMARVAGGGRFF